MGKEGNKLCLFGHDLILYSESPRFLPNASEKLTNIQHYNNTKSMHKKAIAPLYTNNELREREFIKIIPPKELT